MILASGKSITTCSVQTIYLSQSLTLDLQNRVVTIPRLTFERDVEEEVRTGGATPECNKNVSFQRFLVIF